MVLLRHLGRFLGILFFIVIYLVHGSVCSLFVREKWQRRRFFCRFVSRYSSIGRFFLKLKVYTEGQINTEQNYLIVSNHLSYIDVLAIASLWPSCFVTSTEIKETPGLGHICMLAGCLFVDRRTRKNLSNEIQDITEALNNGLNVCIFPEATSTNGDTVIRFRRPLYLAAVEAQIPVQPIVLNYLSVGLRPLTSANRDCVFWYDKMDFLSHLWRATGQNGIELKISVLKPLAINANTDAQSLAEQSHQQVLSHFIPCSQNNKQSESSAAPVLSPA